MPKGIKGFQKGHLSYYSFPRNNKLGKKFQKGHPSYLTNKSKEKLSIIAKKHWRNSKYKKLVSKKISEAKKGKKLSVKHRRKISEAHLKRWDKIGRKKYKPDERIKDSGYIKWRKEVFIRDNFTCQICKKVGGELEAHHIRSWKNYPNLRYDVNNGITLCKKCHKFTDNYKNKAKYYEARFY